VSCNLNYKRSNGKLEKMLEGTRLETLKRHPAKCQWEVMHKCVKSIKRCFHLYIYTHITEAAGGRHDVTYDCPINPSQENRNFSIISLQIKRHHVKLFDLKSDKTIKR